MKIKKIKNSEKNLKKRVDMKGGTWYYIQALAERGFERRAERGRRNLENDTDKERETTVNSEMSFA